MPFYKIKLHNFRPKPFGYPTEIKTIGDHIRAKRIDRGLKQQHVAKLVGVCACTIKNWELGIKIPRTRFGKQIINFLGYNPHPEPETLPEQLIAWRWKEGLRSNEASEKIQVDPATWSSWECGEHSPTEPSRKKLRCLGIKL